eukprot:6195541-Pleurochrysis_carterae.AAC.1
MCQLALDGSWHWPLHRKKFSVWKYLHAAVGFETRAAHSPALARNAPQVPCTHHKKELCAATTAWPTASTEQKQTTNLYRGVKTKAHLCVVVLGYGFTLKMSRKTCFASLLNCIRKGALCVLPSKAACSSVFSPSMPKSTTRHVQSDSCTLDLDDVYLDRRVVAAGGQGERPRA